MSLWFFGPKRKRRRSLYAISHPMVILGLLGVFVALLLPLVQVLRRWLGG